VRSPLPLPVLLSQALVAFTIEFDNEAEHRMQHRTTRHGSSGSLRSPWLVSMAMWFNCMQFVSEEGISVRELVKLARTLTNLKGMYRWGYVTVSPTSSDRGRRAPRSEWLIRATPAGRKAQEVWRPLFGVIEKRWEDRFGEEEIRALRRYLTALIQEIGLSLPDCLPILGYGLTCQQAHVRSSGQRSPDDLSGLPLPALLSKVLLAFALEYEGESELALAIGANVLRVIDNDGARLRDLPRRAGVSKEAIAMAYKFLEKRGYVRVAADAKRVKRILLTPKGTRAKQKYFELVGVIEDRWLDRYARNIREIRAIFEKLIGDASPPSSPLFRGLEPYPANWRASVRKPEMLPHFPMVLHRGGYPDGS
jgi:DNA-binding MarR family transcriptional regulator